MKTFIETEELIFGTKVYQKIYSDSNDAKLILNKANTIMRNFEDSLSFFKEGSDVSRINQNAGKKFVKVSKDTFEIIRESKQFSEMTDGLFDITIAPLVKEWGINTYNPQIIKEGKIKEILSLVSYKDIILEEKNLGVMLAKENQKIDLGAIAKGYIADKVIEFYKESNVISAIINIGGNIKVLGKTNKNKLWDIGIYNPKKHSKDIICSILIENLSIVTSGGYERAFMHDGDIYHHILNPCTGYPAKTDLKSITVVSEDSIKGDAFSTSLFIMGKYKACEFMKKNGISGAMITEDNEIIVTKNLIEKFNLFTDYKILAF